MSAALICSHVPLAQDLQHTLIWRHDFDRHLAATSRRALGLARRLPLDLVLVDAEMPRAVELVRVMRTDPFTSRLSVAVLSRDGVGASREKEFLDPGATDILRLPAEGDWDERLLHLLPVAARREVRYPITVAVETVAGDSAGEATALNVSAGGMLVEFALPIAIGENVRIRFQLPGEAEPISGTAWVVRHDGDKRWGLEFLYLESDGLDRVRRFVVTWKAR